MGVMLIETEPTPNPATLKFLPGRKVMDSGTRDFASPEEAAASPLTEVAAFVEARRAEGMAIDVKLLLLLGAGMVTQASAKP